MNEGLRGEMTRRVGGGEEDAGSKGNLYDQNFRSFQITMEREWKNAERSIENNETCEVPVNLFMELSC